MAEHTEFEKRVMNERRQGKNVEAVQVQTPGGVPIVSLREFAGRATEQMPVPPPPQAAPDVPHPPRLEVVNPMPVQSVAGSQVTESDLEKLKNAAFSPAPAPAPVEPVKADDPLEAPTAEIQKCARCGWEYKKIIAYEPDHTDKVEFIESVLGNRRFVRRMVLLGGRMEVKFRSCLLHEEDMIARFLEVEIDAKRVRSPDEWTIWYSRCRLVLMLHEMKLGEDTKKFPDINNENYAPNKDLKDDTALRRALREVPANWPMTVHGLLIQALHEFDTVYSTLMSRAYDPDFWTGLTEK